VVRPVSVLSPRQLEVALLVARGLSNKAVADELGVLEGTVKAHMHRIFRKLGVSNRYYLILLMKANGARKSPAQ
jgi:DNA-binding NarL/FixJ family response regulator